MHKRGCDGDILTSYTSVEPLMNNCQSRPKRKRRDQANVGTSAAIVDTPATIVGQPVPGSCFDLIVFLFIHIHVFVQASNTRSFV